MPRSLVVAALFLFVSAASSVASCDASVSESCVTGPCASLGTGGTGGAGAGGASTTASATGGSGGSPTADTCSITLPFVARTGDIPCDVFAVVHPNCNPCHQNPPQNGAPFPLLNYGDTQQAYETNSQMQPTKLVYQQMFDQTRPGACPRMPLGGSLDTQDYATLTDWLVGCATPSPAGQGCGCPEDGGMCICEGGPCP